jgi:hypothetical protein
MCPSQLNINESTSRLSFTTRNDNNRPWWRDLDLDGKPLYHISNICETCTAIFSLATEATLPIAPTDLSERFRGGLKTISETLLETIGKILPDGEYIVGLLNFIPDLVEFEPRENYNPYFFIWENANPRPVPRNIWPKGDWSEPWWAIKSSKTTRPGLKEKTLYEAILPLVEKGNLNQTSINSYKEAIEKGDTPTALALSLVDSRYPSGKGFDWRLMHFLLDGHHKVMAACQLRRPITLLSFLNISESFARQEWIDWAIKLRYE